VNNFVKRTLSGIVFVAVFVACILYNASTFCILFAVVAALVTDEFCRIVEDHGMAQPNRTVCIMAGVYLFLASFLYNTRGLPAVVFMPYLFSLLFIIVSEIYQKSKTPIANWAYAFASQIYIALPFALLNSMVTNEDGYSGLLPLSIFIFLWLNDTGAYVTGSLLHKKIPYQLAPRISPHKTWVGSIGGVIVVLAAAVLLCHITHTGTMWTWMGLGLTVSVAGTYGDLTESLMKRHIGMKDSGKFLPGHGGVLDRFDSALLAIPAATIYTYCIHFTC
jgi:phosphatidate cytidylyltransferase